VLERVVEGMEISTGGAMGVSSQAFVRLFNCVLR